MKIINILLVTFNLNKIVNGIELFERPPQLLKRRVQADYCVEPCFRDFHTDLGDVWGSSTMQLGRDICLQKCNPCVEQGLNYDYFLDECIPIEAMEDKLQKQYDSGYAVASVGTQPPTPAPTPAPTYKSIGSAKVSIKSIINPCALDVDEGVEASDVYVMVYMCGGYCGKTSVLSGAKKDKTSSWSGSDGAVECNNIPLYDMARYRFQFKVMDADKNSSDDELGSAYSPYYMQHPNKFSTSGDGLKGQNDNCKSSKLAYEVEVLE